MTNDKLSLYLKHRPKTLDDIVGNEAVVESLRSILSRTSGEVRSFLLTGSSGCGKTTLARIIATELGCSEWDFQEFNTADVRGIDTIREIIESSKYAPTKGNVKIFLLDEAHKTTPDGQNALLKLLEDTPQHVRVILATTDPERLIKTIKNRCTTFHMSPLRRSQMMRLLKSITAKEKDVSDDILRRIVDYSDGSPRQAIVMLDQIIDLDDKDVSMQVLIDATVNENSVLELCQKLLARAKWKEIATMIKSIDEEPEKTRIAIYRYLGKVLLDGNEKAADIMRVFEDPIYNNGKDQLVYYCFQACKI